MKKHANNKDIGEYLRIVELRFLISYLGEQDQLGWWDTAFLGSTGLRFSSVNFPRSYIAASGVSATEAARRLHDSRIGKGGVFHLFRLPPVIEESVHHEILHGDNEPVLEMIATKEAALKSLKERAEALEKAAAGPVQVGLTSIMLKPGSLKKVAGHYLDAFLNDRKTFPYFMDEKT